MFFSCAKTSWYNAFQQFYNAPPFNGDLQNIGAKCLLDYFQIYHIIMTDKTKATLFLRLYNGCNEMARSLYYSRASALVKTDAT